MTNDLVAAALAARLKAHAPYSHFLVGAAVRDEYGNVYSGCNVENASYPQGWCAEPSAISAMIVGGGRRITEVAVVGGGEGLVTPCGVARNPRPAGDVKIHVCGETGEVKHTFTLDELLPAAFGPEHLT
jgi:cytidine deaminase